MNTVSNRLTRKTINDRRFLNKDLIKIEEPEIILPEIEEPEIIPMKKLSFLFKKSLKIRS